MGKTFAVAWLSCALGMTGCALDDGEAFDDLAEDRAGLVVGNGQNLNGQNLNGQNLNGQNLNGSALGAAIAHVELAGASHGDDAFDLVELVGSELRGWIDGDTTAGAGFAGTTMVATSDTGTPLSLRVVDAIAPSGGGGWRYDVEYQETDGSWQPICLDADDQPLTAVALAGYWDRRQGVAGGGDKIADPDRITFACPEVGAIGKCVEIGYRPWASAGGGSLDEHHQACVRLMRNDYCGDGSSHTVDGNLINLYDGVGVQSDTAYWLAEAEWDADGARCLTLNNRRLLALPCGFELADLFCGLKSRFNSGTKLISERPLLGLL